MKFKIYKIRALPKLRWGWILGTSFIILNLVSATIFLITALYATSRAVMGEIPDQAQVEMFTEIVGRWVGPISNFIFTFAATTWLALRLREAPRAHGFFVGFFVSLAGIFYEIATSNPIAPDEWLAALATIGIGWLGGVWGQGILENQEALYHTSQAISGQDKVGMLTAIGEQLASPSVAWVALADENGNLDSDTAWAFSSSQHIPKSIPPIHSQPKLATFIKTDSLPQPIPAIRSLLILPLSNVDESLIIASRNRRGFSRTETQNYQTIAEQISLSLENLKLVEQARQAGIIEERQRLAAEIHDGLTQGFISIVTHLEVFEAKMEQQPPEVWTDFQGLLNQVRQIARENLTAARKMTWALRPDLQKGVPLPDSLEKLVNDWSAGDDISVSFSHSGNMRQLHPDIETALLRTLREALNNIQKHAEATQVMATLTYLDTLVALDIQDNGQGFDIETISPKHGGFGLKSLHEQAERLGGELSVESEIGKGCTIAISIPDAVGEKI